MSYHNSIQEPIANPVGIDKVIEDICVKLGEISWHENIFRRAWHIYESNGKKGITKAKTYLKDSNYYDVLFNNNFKSMSFVSVESSETILEGNLSPEWNNERTRDIAVVFWVNLKQLDQFDFVYTEVLKRDVEKKLNSVESITIKKYFDEDYKQVFKGFDFNQKDLQVMTYPFAGFRFECTATYGGSSYECS